MNIAVDVSAAAKGAAALEADLKALGGDIAGTMDKALRLQSATVSFVCENLGYDIAQIGDALAWFGRIHAALGEATRGLQGLHAAAHEASERLLPSEEKSGSGGGKEPPPKP